MNKNHSTASLEPTWRRTEWFQASINYCTPSRSAVICAVRAQKSESSAKKQKPKHKSVRNGYQIKSSVRQKKTQTEYYFKPYYSPNIIHFRLKEEALNYCCVYCYHYVQFGYILIVNQIKSRTKTLLFIRNWPITGNFFVVPDWVHYTPKDLKHRGDKIENPQVQGDQHCEGRSRLIANDQETFTYGFECSRSNILTVPDSKYIIIQGFDT